MSRFSWADAPSQTAFPIARPGYPFIGAAAFATAVFALLGLKSLSLIGLVAAFCICAFFRDPDRVIPTTPGAVVSPADGKIIKVERVADADAYGGDCLQISIFMTIFNVHVNRISHEGRIVDLQYRPGRFLSADKEAASISNEQNAVTVETPDGRRLVVVQVAGLIARRIVCSVQPGDEVARGQRFGMICFGSRLDVYLPPEADALVARGDRVRAGTSILATLGGGAA
ncbi:MAG: phosphatidylserine decarboxylase family protein [Desulfobacterales bacterium]